MHLLALLGDDHANDHDNDRHHRDDRDNHRIHVSSLLCISVGQHPCR